MQPLAVTLNLGICENLFRTLDMSLSVFPPPNPCTYRNTDLPDIPNLDPGLLVQ